ncbi:MAG TPA: T9SS type A sorting domain-containing protein [Caldithrix abyssi]|uniref:T9SS type A sorting domain-containing protein n=1 Tax=Caldithrix abyssi TaxID=187145 RepID=A0A7V4U3J8_CALAY|nr:T9SS type A sorting domain-containing protein [Caldithrix abyssi]
MFRISKISIYFFTLVVICHSQITDTLKYYYPYTPNDSISSGCAFIDDCYQPGYCEPIATWFTPDSSSPDTGFNVYSIKKIRLCFTRPNKNTSISFYLGSGFPAEQNKIYQSYFSVDSTEVNPYFLDDGKYIYKEVDVSGVEELKNIPLDTSFWVQLDEKVFEVYSIGAKIGSEPYGSGHSFDSYLPNNEGWTRSGCDWIIEAVVEYDKYSDIIGHSLPNVIKEAKLFQNYPNPFNSQFTVIPYELYKPAFVSLYIYTTNGKKVGSFVNQHQKGGRHEIRINVSGLSSGAYFYVLLIDQKPMASRALVLVK